ncbi:hypothetical protein PI125_g4662 [Phytophthora idaei]|nr:hypothetical protein PI125_g4662 [Phytophthora idaei]KAG3125684.1 hypothetical protein PI126_g22655 [Phytophthora idaei]
MPNTTSGRLDLVGTLGVQAHRAIRNRWTSAVLKTKEQIFSLRSSAPASVDASRAGVPPSAGELPSAQPAQGSAESSLWLVAGKRRLSVGAGRFTGEELSSVEPPGGRGQQDPAPKRAGLSYEKSVCKPDLLAVQANVKGFEKPRRVSIDSGASGNYARRSTLEGSQRYVEALAVKTRDTISVRLATGTLVTVSKVSVDLGVKFLDFDSVERCLVLDLDSRYDLTLRMAWLERHGPWIDWRSKTLGATHFAPSGALASHEPTYARKQKRFWRGHEGEPAMVLEIGMSEFVSNEVAVVLNEAHRTYVERHVIRGAV